jgi:Ca2+-binding RTX toxin-like protein
LINATNGGTVTDVGGSFSSIENLNGGTGDDTFTFTTTGSVAGSVNGTSGNDTLVGDNDGNDFAVTGADSGTLATKIGGTWSNIDNLVGGTQADTFTMGVAGSLSGSLDGGQGADLLDYSAYGTSVSVDLTAGPPGTATNITGGLLVGTGGDIGSSVEHVYGGSAADTIVGDVDVNTIRGNGGSDTINARAGIDNVDAGAGTDLIQISGTEAEFDVMQGGPGGVEDPTDYDILRNVGGGNVTLNGFNTVFNVFTNSIDEYQGNGAGILGNGNANELHFGFATMTNTTSLNSGTNNDDVTTSHANVSEVAYDGDAGTDNVTLVLTPDQFGALTTAEIFIVQDYVINPTGKTLSLTADDLKGNFTATNFETAQIAVYDDDIIVDITTCFLAIVSEDQIVEGTMGDDTLTGTNLTDLIFGEDGNDVIYGGNAGDCIFGGANNDTIYGENLNDLLVGGSGNDTLYGGDDEDTIFGNTGVDQLFGEFGHDTLDGGAGNDSLDGGADHDTLNGGPDVDTVLGGSSPDRILIRGTEATTDTIDGGSEYDTLEIIAGTGTATLQGFSLANTGVETVSSIEAIVGNNQTLQGTGGANLFDLTGIVGPTGLASIDGLGGNDTITGTASSDVINGGDGDDILTGGDGFDVINGGNDNDTIDGGLHNDTINGGAGLDTITAGAGFDVVQVSSNEAENDVMNGGADTDTIVALGVSAITLNGFNSLTNSFESWSGNGLSIQGNGNANTLNFQLIGTMTGVPFIDGGSGNDTITGTNGVDELRGSDGDDILIGLGGTDTLRGGNNNDSLNGGDGIDQLYGDAGADTITTGAGRDVVRFANDDTSLDTITDFALYSDVINLSAYGLGWTYGNLTFVVGVGYREVQLPAPFAAKRIRLNGWNRNPGSSQFQF